MTYGSLRAEIPVLMPDEAFVRRLADLAAASTASPGVVVPVSFGSPAARALAAAAAVAAITAGAAAAADQITHTHNSPLPPISTQVTENPSPHSADPTHRAGHRNQTAADHGNDGSDGPSITPPLGALALAGAPGTSGPGHDGPSPDHSSSGPGDNSGPGDSSGPGDNSGPGNSNDPSDDGTSHAGHGGPGDDPTDGGGDGGHHGDDPTGDPSDGTSEDPSDGGSGGNDGDSGHDTGGGGGDNDSGTDAGPSSRLLTGSGD